MTYTNNELERMAGELAPYLQRTDIVGYAAARNTRIIRDEIKDYVERRDALILKHGEPLMDESGNPTGRMFIGRSSPGYAKYAEEIAEWEGAESEPAFYTLDASACVGKLSGGQMLDLEWMMRFGDEDA